MQCWLITHPLKCNLRSIHKVFSQTAYKAQLNVNIQVDIKCVCVFVCLCVTETDLSSMVTTLRPCLCDSTLTKNDLIKTVCVLY